MLLLAQGRPEQGRFLGILTDPGRRRVFSEPAVEVVADGDLALLAALFPEPQNSLGALVLQIPTPQTGHGADAGPGVGQSAEQGAIAQAHHMGSIDRAEQAPGLGVESPGVLPSEVSCFLPRTDWKGFRGAACRVTRVSKKCRRPARPGETLWSSRCSSSHQERKRLTTRA